MRDFFRGLPVVAGVREPHAMTISTSGVDGPDARVLISKDVAVAVTRRLEP